MSEYDEGSMTGLGITNAGWGVCGFTSSFYAMYANSDQVRPRIINATEYYRVLAEIKTYLNMLKAENSPFLAEITRFTRSFGGLHANFTVDKYITKINQAAARKLRDDQIKEDEGFGIGMPPFAVADYLKRMWDKAAKVTMGNFGSLSGEGIVGVSEAGSGTKEMYYGLKHYLYFKGGIYYSWGDTFTTIPEAMGGSKWRGVYLIQI